MLPNMEAIVVWPPDSQSVWPREVLKPVLEVFASLQLA
jgi:hypothetical protein